MSENFDRETKSYEESKSYDPVYYNYQTKSRFNDLPTLKRALDTEPKKLLEAIDYYQQRPKFQSLYANLLHLSWPWNKKQRLDTRTATTELLKIECIALVNFLVKEKAKMTGDTPPTLIPKAPRPQDYSDIEQFVSAFKLYLKINKVEDDAQMSAHFQLAIMSHQTWNNYVQAAIKVKDDIGFAALTAKIVKAIKPETGQKIAEIICQLVHLTQREPSKKSLQTYYEKFQEIANRADDKDLGKNAKVALFIQNLQNSNVIWGMYDETKDDLESIFLKAQRIETSNESINWVGSQGKSSSSRGSQINSSSKSRGCNYCKIRGRKNWTTHREKYCFQKHGNGGKSNSYRKRFGDVVRKMSDLLNTLGSDDETETDSDDNESFGEENEGKSSELGLGSQRINSLNDEIIKIRSLSSGELIPIKLTRILKSGQKRQFKAKLDTGASRTCVSLKYADENDCTILPIIPKVQGFDNQLSTSIKGMTDITLKVGGEIAEIRALVVENMVDNLIGMDLLSRYPGEMCKKGGKMRFRFFAEDTVSKVYALEQTVLPAYSTKVVKIKNLSNWKDKRVMLTQKEGQKAFTCPNAVTDQHCDKILLVNHTGNDYVVKSGEQIAEIAAVATDSNDLSQEPGNPKKVSEAEYEVLVEEALSHLKSDPIKFKKAKEILMRTQKYFDCRSDKEVGLYKKEQINLNPNNEKLQVKKQKRRIFPQPVWDAANPEIDILRRNDLVEESKFATISPANIVLAKRAGSDRPRLCIDYKLLNLELMDCFHVTESLESIMLKIGSFEVMSNLDCSSAYWNLELTENCRDLTAFYGENCVYRWKRMPFGIKTGAQWMQKVLSSIILEKAFQQSLGIYSSVSLFIDDLMLVGNWEDHFDDLEKLINQIGKNGFILKFAKCNFFKKSLKFLGVKIKAPGTIEIDDEFLEDLDKIRLPENTNEVRKFLGIFNWRAGFLDHFYDLAEPLYALLKGKNVKKSEKVTLEQEHIQSIKNLIHAAKNAAKLSLPQFGINAPPFTIEVDASSVGFGCCLRQGDNIISYASKSLSAAGKNYENAHRELCALMWAVQKFNRFIAFASKKTIVYTDNKIVSFLKNATNTKLVRWRTQLAGYNLDIRHRKGTEMRIADPLSRLLKPDPEEKEDAGLRQMQEEIVVAFAQEELDKIQSSMTNLLDPKKDEQEGQIDKVAEIFGLHYKEGHCKSKRLKDLYPHLSESLVKTVIAKCPECILREPVKKIMQVPGTVFADPEKTRKNEKWYLDFVFPKFDGKKKVILSILDRDTDYFMAKEVGSREHKKLVRVLEEIFPVTGVPNTISADREFDSELLDQLAQKYGFAIELLPRESPHVNLVERKHKDMKEIWAVNRKWSLNDVVNQMNKFKKIGGIKSLQSPSDLFQKNMKNEIIDFRNVRVMESDKRAAKIVNLRGRNIKVFEKKFSVGDLVKFPSLLNKYDLKFGKITKVKSKFIEIQKLNSDKKYTIHSEKLKKLPSSYENILNRLLR